MRFCLLYFGLFQPPLPSAVGERYRSSAPECQYRTPLSHNRYTTDLQRHCSTSGLSRDQAFKIGTSSSVRASQIRPMQTLPFYLRNRNSDETQFELGRWPQRDSNYLGFKTVGVKNVDFPETKPDNNVFPGIEVWIMTSSCGDHVH